MNLRESPESAKVFLDTGYRLYDFDGTPYSRPDAVDGWEPVNTAPVRCLSEWQADPGCYGFAPYLVTQIAVHHEGREPVRFVAGGSAVYIHNWIIDREEEGAVVSTMPIGLYASRQVARSHPLVTVEW